MCKTYVHTLCLLSWFVGTLQWPQQLNASLEEVDPELFDIIEKEKNRQWKVSNMKTDCRKLHAMSFPAEAPSDAAATSRQTTQLTHACASIAVSPQLD